MTYVSNLWDVINIKKLKPAIILLTFIILALAIIYVHYTFKVYSNSTKYTVPSVTTARRGTPAYNWSLGNFMIPHMKIFFWIPKEPNTYVAFADKSVKSYISRHGAIEKWGLNDTGRSTNTEKEVFIYIPKSFVLLNGKDFYKHIYIEIVPIKHKRIS